MGITKRIMMERQERTDLSEALLVEMEEDNWIYEDECRSKVAEAYPDGSDLWVTSAGAVPFLLDSLGDLGLQVLVVWNGPRDWKATFRVDNRAGPTYSVDRRLPEAYATVIVGAALELLLEINEEKHGCSIAELRMMNESIEKAD